MGMNANEIRDLVEELENAAYHLDEIEEYLQGRGFDVTEATVDIGLVGRTNLGFFEVEKDGKISEVDVTLSSRHETIADEIGETWKIENEEEEEDENND